MRNLISIGGDIEKLNLMMFVAVVLDPRYKLRFVNFWFAKWNPGAVADDMTKKVEKDSCSYV